MIDRSHRGSRMKHAGDHASGNSGSWALPTRRSAAGPHRTVSRFRSPGISQAAHRLQEAWRGARRRIECGFPTNESECQPPAGPHMSATRTPPRAVTRAPFSTRQDIGSGHRPAVSPIPDHDLRRLPQKHDLVYASVETVC